MPPEHLRAALSLLNMASRAGGGVELGRLQAVLADVPHGMTADESEAAVSHLLGTGQVLERGGLLFANGHADATKTDRGCTLCGGSGHATVPCACVAKALPTPVGEPTPVVARGEPMVPPETWRARQLGQARAYERLCSDYRALLHGGKSSDATLPALLLYSLGGDVEYEPVAAVLTGVLEDLRALSYAFQRETADPSSVLREKLYMLARQVEVALELHSRSKAALAAIGGAR